MLVTDNKDYKGVTDKSADIHASHQNLAEECCKNSLCDRPELYKAAKSADLKFNFVYTSCHHKLSANAFPYAMLPRFNKPLPTCHDTKSAAEKSLKICVEEMEMLAKSDCIGSPSSIEVEQSPSEKAVVSLPR